jgi:hypothetical protein
MQQASIFPNAEEVGPIWLLEAIDAFREIQTTSHKFSIRLDELLATDDANGYVHLVERCGAALNYFTSHLGKWRDTLATEIRNYRLQRRQKKPLAILRSLEERLESKERLLEQTMVLARGLSEGRSMDQLIGWMEEERKATFVPAILEEPQPEESTKGKPKVRKEPSARISLDLYSVGHDLGEIARLRNVSITTIYSHLIPFLASGEVVLDRLVEPVKAARIREVAAGLAEARYKAVREALGEGFSYDEIRAVLGNRGDSPSE